MLKSDWTLEELKAIHELPLFELLSRAHICLTKFHKVGEIQICKLISIKTGGCAEDCKYCAQSSRYQTAVKPQPRMTYEAVIKEAKNAIAKGATRICLGAAWREVIEGKFFEDILLMVQGIKALGAEVCCTLGMLKEEQARRLQEAGLYAYNHNLDSSEKFYNTIITTRKYQDRINTLDIVQKTGLSVCCGGILGMGETSLDRLELLLNLSQRQPHPESVPINCLSRIPGTPLETMPSISIWEVVRTIATARIIMPKTMLRLSCGRIDMSYEQQTLCFFAGINSIFSGEKLLTVTNNAPDQDDSMFQLLGLTKRPSYQAVRERQLCC